MESAQALLKSNLEREKTLKGLRENPKENSAEISKLLLQLRNDYQQLIVEHTRFSCSSGNDIDGILWKQCFYRQIEEYRRSIRKTVQLLDQNNNSSSERGGDGAGGGSSRQNHAAMTDKARTHLAKLTAAFAKFLSDSALFYQELMIQLETRFKAICNVDLAEIVDVSSSDEYLRCISRCLLYLGDLARYKELYAERREKDYTEADRYYGRAAFMIPFTGNPQNQLAVLATYTDNEFVAVYHYCRSVMVQQPFTAGFENLSVLFEKNGRLYKQLKSGEGQQQLLESLSHITDKNKKVVAYRVKSFLITFVRLHGVLFGWTRKAAKLLASSNSTSSSTSNNNGRQTVVAIESAAAAGHPDGSSSSGGNHQSNADTTSVGAPGAGAVPASTSSKPPSSGVPRPEDLAAFNAEGFREMCQSVLDEFDSLLSASAFGETLLTRMLILCIFNVHHASSLLLSPSPTTAAANNTAGDGRGRGNSSQPPSTTKERRRRYYRDDDEEDEEEDQTAAAAGKPRSLSESLALFLTFGFVNKVAKRVASVWDSAEGNGKLRLTAVKALLPVLSVFAEWVTTHQQYLLTAEVPAGGATATRDHDDGDVSHQPHALTEQQQQPSTSVAVLKAVEADGDATRAESRARSSLRSVLSGLRDAIEICIRAHAGPSGSESKKTDIRGKPLKEHVELRGFLPLADQYELFFEGVEPLINKLPIVPDEIARDRRLRVLRTFIKNWPENLSAASLLRGNERAKQSRREGGGGGEGREQHGRGEGGEVRAARGGMLKLTPEISGAMLDKRSKEKGLLDKEERRKSRRERRGAGARGGEGGGERDEGGGGSRRDRDRRRGNGGDGGGGGGGEGRREKRGLNNNSKGGSSSASKQRSSDVDFDRLQKRRDNRTRGSNDEDGQGALPDEEFPPLPGSKEPSVVPPAALSYASSALFNHTAPTSSNNPFASDSEDDDDESDEDDDDDEDEDGDDDEDDDGEENSPDLIARELGVGFRGGAAQIFAAEIDADEVFGTSGGGGGDHVHLAGLLGQRSLGSSALLSGASAVSPAGQRLVDPLDDYDDDDDLAEDVVVFKPAFSRVFGTSTSVSSSSIMKMASGDDDHLSSLGLRGVNSLGNFEASGLGSLSGKGDNWWNTSPSLGALTSPDPSGISGLDLGHAGSSSTTWWNEGSSSAVYGGSSSIGIAHSGSDFAASITTFLSGGVSTALASGNSIDTDINARNELARIPPPPPALRGPPAVPFMASSGSSGKAVPPPPGFSSKPPASVAATGGNDGNSSDDLWTANPFFRPG